MPEAVGFIVSKLAWLVLRPGNFLGIVLLAGVLLGWHRLVRATVLLAAVVILLPVGLWLRAPLEDRFARPDRLPETAAGIIVLGGPQQPHVTAARGVIALDHAGERLIEGLALAERYPEARLVFSGDSGRIGGRGGSEQLVNEVFVALMGIDPTRVVYEDRSRNTWENARFTRELVDPRPDETWLLVTSASHMPRAMGIFRQTGFPVTPWPVDYRTTGAFTWPPGFELSERLLELDQATREYLGLLYYHLLGRTDALFPAP